MRTARRIGTIGILFLANACFCLGGQVTLQWDRNTEPYLGGYLVRYGRASGSYTSSVDTGLNNQRTVSGLSPGVRYYFVVVAYDSSRQIRSGPSNEVTAVIPSEPTPGIPSKPRPDPPSASFTARPTQASAPLSVAFTNTSKGTISTYSWNFGDGTTSTAVSPTHRYSQSGAFTVKLTVTGPGGTRSSIRQNLVKVFPKLQFGEKWADHNWVRVQLDPAKRFGSPIVVAEPLSEQRSDPAVVRMDNVNSTGFDLAVQEWDYQDSHHVFERIGYLVMDRGSHLLPNGVRVEANRFTSPGYPSFRSIKFLKPFNTIPVVVLSVASRNGADTVTTRLRNVTRQGFEYRLQEQQSNSYEHTSETLSYVAWEVSTGLLNGIRYEVNRTGTNVTDRLRSIVFKSGFRSAPALLAECPNRE